MRRYIEMGQRANEINPASGIDSLNKSPIECSISEIRPIRLEIVSGSSIELLWDDAAREYI